MKDLFDIIAESEAKERPKEECKHPKEEKTFTIWPGHPNDERMTWTCTVCGRIRGRV